MANQSEWRKLRKRLKEQGLKVVISKGTSHYKVYRDGQLVTTMPGSPGGGRGLPNQRAQLRRLGISV